MLQISGLGDVPSTTYNCTASGVCKGLYTYTAQQFRDLQTLINNAAKALGVKVSVTVDGAIGSATYSAFRAVVNSPRFPTSQRDRLSMIGNSVSLVQNYDAADGALRAAGLMQSYTNVVSTDPVRVPTPQRAPVQSSQPNQTAIVDQNQLPPMATAGAIPGWMVAVGGVTFAIALAGLAMRRLKGKRGKS